MYFLCRCTKSTRSKSERHIDHNIGINYQDYSGRIATLLISFIFSRPIHVFRSLEWQKISKRSCIGLKQPCSFLPGDYQDCIDHLVCIETGIGPKYLPSEEDDPIGGL